MQRLRIAGIGVSAVLLVVLATTAAAAALAGKINGISCAIAGVVCPIDKLDALVALEKDFVLQIPDGRFFVIPNVDRAVKARLVLEDVIINGEINWRYHSINAHDIQVRRNGEIKTIWSEAIVKDLQKELFESPD